MKTMHQTSPLRKGIAMLLAFCMAVALSASAFAAPPADLTWEGKPASLSYISQATGLGFVDSNGNYKPIYEEQAKKLWENGLFLGSNGSFDLDNPMTRIEGVVMAIRMLGKENEAKAYAGVCPFTDVPEWAAAYAAYAYANGIANGYSATTFGSSDLITANQFITFALRAMGFEDGTDFTWNKAADKAYTLGLISSTKQYQYNNSNLFMRDDAAYIAHNAVFVIPAKSGEKLESVITMPGRPAGDMPALTRKDIAKPATPGAPAKGESDTRRLGYLLGYTERALSLVHDCQNGKKPQSSGMAYVSYTANGALESYLFGHLRIVFQNSQPILLTYAYGNHVPSISEAKAAYADIGNGMYDFAADAENVGVYFFGSGGAPLTDLASFQAVSNNGAITEELFTKLKNNLSDAYGSNAAILYARDGNGTAYGMWALLNIAGMNPSNDSSCQLMYLNPHDDKFGTIANIRLEDY